MSRLENTLKAIDAMHAQDPEKELVNGETRPAELVYAERMTQWLNTLSANPGEEVQIAVRSQHLCRWEIPRSDYPMDKPGYFKWRTDLGKLHADKAAEAMTANGYDEETIEQTKKIIRKQNLKTSTEAQLMEDCACLVFIETGFLDFAAKYPEEKVIDIVQKTWKKMSEGAHEAALKLSLPDKALTLIQKALS
ncbi:MAG: DUF4202 domain-containing protein [Lentisphaeraceae bacterium]|nr:DUF4202 domain-containing protein [Lentisphaeraceae bacterium]